MFPHPTDKTNLGDYATINLAAFVPQTRVLGPGLRAGVWVQGCPFSCPGCIAPEWIVRSPNQIVQISDLLQRILAEPVTGLTISGGEPFLQAPALSVLIRQLRQVRELNIMIFSGYTLPALQRMPHASSLLAEVDLLIDGTYVASLNKGVGLRGSENQNFHFLTQRITPESYPFETTARGTELHFQDNDLLVVGIPAHGVQLALDQAMQSVRHRSVYQPLQMGLEIRA